MKKTMLIFAALFVIFAASCVKEPAIAPSADFTLNKSNLETGEDFVVYLENAQGDFLTYFKGDKENTIYSDTNYQAEGTSIDIELDSIVVGGYSTAGTYKFTIVASSSGNWAEDYEQDIKNVDITVNEAADK